MINHIRFLRLWSHCLMTRGGIKMVDIYKKDQSLKVTWIKRIWEEPEYHICPTLDKVNKIPTKLLFKCNLHSKDIAHCWKKLPAPFWVDMITVGELRSTLCTKTPLYVRSDSYIRQMPLEHLSYIKQMPLEHLSYIKETSWNTSDRT